MEINKYALLVILIILIIVSVTLFYSLKKTSSETYNFLPSSNNVLLTDTNGNMSTYNTQKGTLLLTNETGNMTSLPFPKGIVMMWNGAPADIQTGWAICDGQTSYTDLKGTPKKVPDLRGKFVVGVGLGNIGNVPLTIRSLGDTGGGENHTLITSEMPSHNHSLLDIYFDSGSSPGSDVKSGTATSAFPKNDVYTGSTGGDQPHNNMPPFYALCYICYVGGL